MRTAGLSLYDLVAEAHARCPTPEAIREWYARHTTDPLPSAVDTAKGWGGIQNALAAAARGDFLSASKAAKLFSDDWLWSPEEDVDLDASAAWCRFLAAGRAFLETCELALRIDSFLATLLRERVVGALARDCCKDLSVLLVLADWAEENGRLTTAAEARHLHSLVRYRG
jgi:hypothetical protein